MSFRSEFKHFVVPMIDGASEVKLAKLTDEVVAWMQSDGTRLSRCVDELLRPIVYEMVQREVARTRRAGMVIINGTVVTRETLEEKARQFSNRWATWLEHAGDRNIRLLEATAPDLAIMANERYRRAGAEQAIGDLWLALAKGLSSGQKVGDVFTPGAIEDMWQKITGEESA